MQVENHSGWHRSPSFLSFVNYENNGEISPCAWRLGQGACVRNPMRPRRQWVLGCDVTETCRLCMQCAAHGIKR